MSAPTPTGQPWSLRRRVIALCLLGATVIAFLTVGAATTAIANRGELDRLLDDIGPMRTAASTLSADLVDQETGLRGYVVNGNLADLTPYTKGLEDQQKQIATLTTNPATTDAVRDEVATVKQRADAWRSTVADPAIAAVQRGDRVAASAFINDQARASFDSVRAAADALQATVQSMRDQSVTSVRDTNTTLLFVLIVAAVMVLASSIGLVVALQLTVIAPITRLAAQVRSVARGEYNREIVLDGPPELRNLGHDVDLMRVRIAADLAEVERARAGIEEANAQLEQQAAELVRSNRDLEQFAYVASHDLQEPLRKVASFCQLLQRRYEGQLDERADQYIAFAVNGAQRMQRLINDLLAFSRIGRNTTGFTDVDLDRVVAEAAEQAGGERDDVFVTWRDLPTVHGEEALLLNLFANLIGNSIKFRRPDVPATIDVSARRVGDNWEITCADNGIGIESEYADKVFVIFQRLHPRDAYPGTGIGLAVAKKIVEYHGGAIWLDPDRVDGTAIRFTLPAVAGPELSGPLVVTSADDHDADAAVRTREPVG